MAKGYLKASKLVVFNVVYSKHAVSSAVDSIPSRILITLILVKKRSCRIFELLLKLGKRRF